MHFVFPPRPKSKIDPARLPEYEKSGKWWAQWKYNGTRTLVYIEPDRTVRLYERHGNPHKQYDLTPATKSELLALDLAPGKGYVLDGELMHNKTKTIKDVIVLYDVLWAGKYLFGSTTARRLEILAGICHHPTAMEPTGRGLAVSDHLWLAPTFESDFVRRFNEALPDDAREGLVLKQPAAKLNHMGGVYYEVPWVLRCRKPHKNYEH